MRDRRMDGFPNLGLGEFFFPALELRIAVPLSMFPLFRAQLSQRLSAGEVADMLDRLYLRFDTLAEQHGLFKIDTSERR